MTPGTDAALRSARRDRVFAAMAAAGLDALVLSRRPSVAYATGARSLWTAGTRPFGAACVLVSAGRTVHLLSTWDAGVPPDIPFDHLYGITWNPSVMLSALRRIDGLAAADRLGVDALSPGFVRAMGRLAPGATLVPADDLVQTVRMVKLPAEVARIRSACAVARLGMDAAMAALESGATPPHANAAAVRALAAAGATVPSSGIVVTPRTVDVGMLVDGYEGGMGRSLDSGGSSLHDDLVAACRPGRTADDLRAAAAAAGVTSWMIRGTGMGFESPVITGALGDDVVLQPGMVLSVELNVAGRHHRDVVHVAATTTEVLSR